MLELRMLGQIRLLGADGAEIDAVLRQPKRLALLAYLAMPAPGTWHRRDTLLALFWPDRDTTHARNSLRNALYVLRQSLGDGAIRTRGDEELTVDASALRTDVAAVWEALRQGEAARAIAHYRGDLLPGLFPPDSEGFQRWLDSERARLRVAVTASATARAAELERLGEARDALSLARLVLEIRADDETLVRRVMALHERVGDRAGGLAAFEQYRARLADEFEAAPAAETLALAQRLRAPATAAATAPATVDASAPDGEHAAASPLATPDATVDPYAGVTRARVERRTSDERGTPAPSAPPRVRVRPPLAVGLLGVGAIASMLAWSATRPARAPIIGRSQPLTTEEGLQVQPAISRDGRMVAYAMGTPYRLRIMVRLVGGAAWPLTGDTAGFEQFPRWSPNDDRVLFLSRNHAFVANSHGGSVRIVAQGSDGDGMVRSASWSPTGDSIAIVRRDSLLVRPVRGNGTRFVGTAPQLHSCTWSPDGRWIACTSGNWIRHERGPLFGNELPSAVVLFPAAGGAMVDVTGHEFQHRSPAWSRDGRLLWIVSDRAGASEAFAIPIARDGRPAGDPMRLGLPAEAVTVAADRIAYTVPVRRSNVWSVPANAERPLGIADATRLTSGTALIETFSVSRDGRWLVYDSNESGNADLYRMPARGGTPERLTDDPAPEYAGELSPDGAELAWHRVVGGRRRVFVRRLDGGGETEVGPAPMDQGVPRWSPDGRAIAGWSHATEEGALFVVRRDQTGRWGPVAWRLDKAQLPQWSPDGRTLAFLRYDGSIALIPADSGAQRIVWQPGRGADSLVATQLAWRDDPETISFLASDASGRGGIWTIDLPGGRPVLRVSLADEPGRTHGPALMRDQERYYFTLDERFSNVRWAEVTPR